MGELKENGIFYGDNSRKMWSEINELRDSLPQVWEALYSIACKLQELERKVEEME